MENQNKNDTPESILNESVGKRTREVNFEVVHNQSPEQLKIFVEIIDPKPDQKILDSMSGYGAVTREILAMTEQKGFTPEIYLLDNSSLQLNLAKKNLKIIDDKHLIESGVESTPFPEDMFDTVVMKMGLHELPKKKQIDVLAEMFRILKKDGRFITWELALENIPTQIAFQDIMRKKDELAGFNDLVANRYFQTHDELVDFLEKAGFSAINVEQTIISELSMRTRESELVSKNKAEILKTKGSLSKEDEDYLADLGRKRCDDLILFIKEYMTHVADEVISNLRYKEIENDIFITPNFEVLVGIKK
jgi:ubiquinone/menaquinone biosynthesis C-methylase UbiE